MFKKRSLRIISMIIAGIMMISALSMSVFAKPNSDIPEDMLDNAYLDALAYTGYNVKAQKNDGSIFVTYGSSVSSSVRSNIGYGTSLTGLETVSKNDTATGKAPDIKKFEDSGLCCATYVTYVYYNYLPNIAGIDTSKWGKPDNTKSSSSYNEQAKTWISNGKARRIKFEQDASGDNFKPDEKIPIGSLVVFENKGSGDIAHVALYAGKYNGTHFVTHVGNERGPEISTIVGMSKGGNPEVVTQIVAPSFVEEEGTIEVKKKDTEGKNLAGAVFVATNDDTGEEYKIGPTNAKGYASVEGVPYGTYTVKETVFPENYRKFDKSKWTVKVNSSNKGIASFEAVNELIPGTVRIVKTSDDGKVEGISFTIAGEGINKTVTTNENGVIRVDELKPGTYKVTEKEYDRYEPQETQTVKVVTGEVTRVNFSNVLKRGSLQVIKSSDDGFIANMTFRLYGTSMSGAQVDEYATTDDKGIAKFEDVPIGTGYTIEEVGTPDRYVVPEKQTVTINWKEVTTCNFINALKKFSVAVTKRDAEKRVAQGNAKLSGAVYGIYKGNTLVDKYVTDKDGKFTTKEYTCDDDWTIKEITPSEGYLLDNTIHKVGAKPEHYTIEHNKEEANVVEQVMKGKIAIIKHTDDGKTQIETPEKGAKFEIYLKSAGGYKMADTDERDTIVCDDNGFAQTKDMPYGLYTVHQVEGWEGRELMKDFDVFIAKNGQTYRFIINNRNFESFIKVVKIDKESGKTIPYAGAGFKIYDPDGKLVTMTFTYPTPTKINTFYTNDNGTLVTPEKLEFGKNYSIVEVQAPYGYVLDNTPIYFDVTQSNSVEENGVTIIKVNKSNIAQKGVIKVEKSGEVFFDVNVSGSDSTELIYQPVYKVSGLKGAVYEIRAAENIYTPDGTLRYSKGKVVDTITTDKDGCAKSKELYLGKYEVKEVKAPFGMVLSEKVHSVELVYAGQNIAVTETSTSFYNERQKVEISILKILEVNDMFNIGANGEIKNVSFGLYADEEIISVSGKIIPADALIEVVNIGEDGKGVLKTDLPFGRFYVKEIASDRHYKLNDTKYPVEFKYEGQNKAIVKIIANNGNEIENKLISGSVLGKKVDENGKALGGAVIGLFASNDTKIIKDNAIMTTTSKEDGSFSFENIPYGVWYIREIEQPTGFVLSETLFEVRITKDKEVVEIEIVNEFVRGNISLTKIDEDYLDNKLTGAVFEVFKDTNDNGLIDESDEFVGNLNETKPGIYELSDLLYGRYLVRESKAPEGFLIDKGVYSVFIETDGKTYVVENKAGIGFLNQAMKGSLKIVKTSSNGKIEGFEFRITGPNGYDKTFKTNKRGEILIEGLRVGEYIVSEIKNEVSSAYVLPEDKKATVKMDATTVVKMHNKHRDVPKTGDKNNLGILLVYCGLSAVALIALSIVARKKKKKDREE